MINTILIIEDENSNADRLRRLIKAIKPKAEILDALESVADSIDWFNTHDEPDVVIMDIRLADGVSFDIFNHTNITCPIIFTTAYDEYAVKAFKYNSIDYLLKPVDQDELQSAFDKLESLSYESRQKSIEGLLAYYKPKEFRSRFLLPFKDGYKSVLVSGIAYFCSELKITRAKLCDGSMEIVPQTLEELELQLDPKKFFRANRQYIINIDSIECVQNTFNGKLKIKIRKNPDTEVIVSRDKAALLKAWMNY